jgi:tRNA (adenine22-N1)-methyltransferase
MSSKLINLDRRLQAVASCIRNGAVLGDVGTDHAYLPVYLAQRGIIDRAVGVDVHEGPYRSALATVRAYGLESRISIRKGNGLEPIGRGEVNVLVLAGMGGNTIRQILAAGKPVLEEVEEMVLQPQGAEGKVRVELINGGWKIKNELLVEEEGKIYTVIYFSRTAGWDRQDIVNLTGNYMAKMASGLLAGSLDHAVLQKYIEKAVWGFGPVIIAERSQLFRQLLTAYRQRLQKVAAAMELAASQEVWEKVKNIREEIIVLEGIEQCLFQ